MTGNSDHKESGKKPPEPPPVLVPPDGSEPQQTAPSRTVPLLVLGLGLLLVAAAVVVLFLPVKQDTPTGVQTQVSQPANKQPPPPPDASPPRPTNLDGTAQETNRLLEQWLQKQAAAEAENIAAWGGEPYAQAVSQARECEQLLADKQFSAAREACTTAIGSLEQLMAAKESLLAEALRAGLQALEKGAPGLATGQFQRALAIDADNHQARQGLRRAERLPKVQRLIETGQNHEQAGDTQAALKAYAEASSLDPDFSTARERRDRLQATIAERQFNQAMSRALQALNRGDLSTAATALKNAQTYKSNDPALHDLKQQLAQAQLGRKLDGLRQKSAGLEMNENWREALKTCDQALALDARAAFAVNCRERVSQRIELDGRLQSILSRPERLFADAPLSEARQLLTHASQVTPRGSKISSQIEQLTQLIRQAEVEVEVVIRSDGLTDVVVYHVGRLGRFEEKKLVLRTGNYTATGSRNGYRDVRQTLRVRPDSERLVFTLRCEEPI